MKNNFFLMTAISMLIGCNQSMSSDGQSRLQSKTDIVKDAIPKQLNLPEGSIRPCNLLTLSDAEKIMGQQARLIDSSSTIKNNVSVYNCGYTGISEDEKTGKIGKLYFVFWQYDQISSAEKAYTSIKIGNEINGIKVLNDLGDEAYYHSDGVNFYFIIVRKGKKVFDIKVNKITSTTSLDEFNLVAKNITALL